jgi:hypothetical protein
MRQLNASVVGAAILLLALDTTARALADANLARAMAKAAGQVATATAVSRCAPPPSVVVGTPAATFTPHVVPNLYAVGLYGDRWDPMSFQLAEQVGQQYGIPVFGVNEYVPGFITEIQPDRVAAVRAEPLPAPAMCH